MRRKPVLPLNDDTEEGLTSMCNTSESAHDMRAQALQIEQTIKFAQRYETVTLTDLSSWPADSDVHYSTLPKGLQRHVNEYFMWSERRNHDA